MNHQPYLDWLFIDLNDQKNSLTGAQRESLLAHLDDCPECRRLSEAWQNVDQELRAAPQLFPRAGFTQRWLYKVEAERQLRHRRQTLVIFGITSGLAMGLLAILLLYAWPYLQTPELILWSYIYQLLRWAAYVSAGQAFLGNVLEAFGRTFPSAGWILVAGVVCQLFVLWFVSFRFFTMPRRVTK